MIVLATSVALLIAIITTSFAWFAAQGAQRVYIETMQLQAASRTNLVLDIPELSAEYERYMGQTGIQYDGDDYPYLVEYSPISITFAPTAEYDEGTYMVYYIDSGTTYIKMSISGSEPTHPSSDDLWDNFVINLKRLELIVDEETGEPILDGDGNETFSDTGEMYYGENGYFRDVSTGSLLSITGGTYYFTLYLYFQGDVGYHLLQETQEDIDEKYTFDYSVVSYMFARFHLSAVFDLQGVRSLAFTSGALDTSYEEIEDVAGSTAARSITGFDFVNLSDTYPIPELYKQEEYSTPIDYSHYFVDWIYTEQDEDENDVFYIYRKVKAEGTASNVVTMRLKPFREKNPSLRSMWGNSYAVTFSDGLTHAAAEEYEPDVAYVRPRSNFYQGAGYMTYDTVTQVVTVHNPAPDDSGELVYKDAYTIAAPTRQGYRFLGWATTAQTVPLGQQGINHAFTAGNNYRRNVNAATTLYAVWQEIGVNVTFHLNETWGDNYATVVGTNVTGGGHTYTNIVDGAITVEIAKHTNLTTYNANATATITSTSTARALTVKYWTYYDSSSKTYVKVTNSYDLTDDVDLYPVWNQRGEYTLTLDTRMAPSTQTMYGKFNLSNPINLSHYTLVFNDGSDHTSGSIGNANNDVTVKVLEGMSLADLGLSFAEIRLKLGVSDTNVKGTGLGKYDFENWYTGANNDKLPSAWGSNNGTVYDPTTAITSNLTVYARFD